MGLLDDAIREHLDLKRRRGADPTEVERAEREALGPARRGPEAPSLLAQSEAYTEQPVEYHDADDGWDELTDDHGAPGPLTADSQEYDDEHEYELVPDDEFEPYEAAGAAPPEPALHPAAPVEPVIAPPAASLSDHPESPPVGPTIHAAEPELPAPASAHAEPTLRPPGFGETVEYDVERALDAELEEPVPEEDVLEETPDFLQDTPDHDRLWFEQRPPRDFKFDG